MLEILFQLFWEFFKTGLFAIGGGLATLPFLYDIANRYVWFDAAQIGDMIAISESTPGPIGINMATYAGFNAAGIPGALVATLSLVLPSVIIIMFVALILNKFKENKLVKDVFYGIRPATVGLIAAALFGLITMSLINGSISGTSLNMNANWPGLVFFAAALFVALRFKKVHPVFIILAGALAGIFLKIGL